MGSLGIPVGGIPFPGFSKFYHFHDTELSNHVHHAYHAIATNEYREPYFPTLWTRLADSQPRPADLPVEQRWFIGAHSDIGGGYQDGSLQTLPASWLQEKARQAGLEAGTMQRISTDYEQCEPHDSYKEFTEKVPIPVKRRAPVVGPGYRAEFDDRRSAAEAVREEPGVLEGVSGFQGCVGGVTGD